MVEEKSFGKILEWMEQIGMRIKKIEDILLDHTQKFETLFDIVHEMRDDMRLIKRTVNFHDDELLKLKNQFKELSKGLL